MFSDQPIKNSQTDLFGRKTFSKRIANIVANRTEDESIAIGIHAPWVKENFRLKYDCRRVGRTSSQKRQNLAKRSYCFLKFNPWRFSDENQLLEIFFTALADKSEGRIETTGKKFLI